MSGKSNEKEPFLPRFSCKVEQSVPPGLRLDRYAAEYLKLFTRSQIKNRELRAAVNGKETKMSRLLKGSEILEFSWKDPLPPELIPQDLPLDIVFEDERVAVINKAQGMVVHPGAGNFSGTLANALYYRRLKQENAGNDSGKTPGQTYDARPGIVHRLDKDTSGLIITAWDQETHLFLADQFKQRRVIKTYAAIVRGSPAEKTGRIDLPICRDRHNRKLFTAGSAGKPCLTFYRVARSWNNYSLLLLRPKTGRTHQIRVHLKHLGFPVAGDPLYGKKDPFFPDLTLMLHAKRLTLRIPEKGRQTFRTAFPDRFYDFFSYMKTR